MTRSNTRDRVGDVAVVRRCEAEDVHVGSDTVTFPGCVKNVTI